MVMLAVLIELTTAGIDEPIAGVAALYSPSAGLVACKGFGLSCEVFAHAFRLRPHP